MNDHASTHARRHDIDWLRIGAVLLLIPFHTARIFDVWEAFYVKSAETSKAMSYLIIGALNPWHMPLLFLLAGASTWLALRHRTPGQYATERLKRLLIPFLFGVAVVVPPQAYLARFQTAGYSASYWQFLVDYVNLRGDLSGYTGLFTPGHLWFILFLFVIALALLPLLVYLRGEAGMRWLARVATWMERPGTVFLLAIPLLLMDALPAPGGKNPFFYGLLFVYGYCVMADGRFQGILDRHAPVALPLAVVSLLAVWWANSLDPGWSRFSWQDITIALVRDFGTWSWMIALLGLGHRFLNRSHKILSYAGEAAYPFYILHQTAIIAIGYLVVEWPAGVWVKFLVIAAVSLLVTLAVYDLVVKRVNVTRFLFGMKPLPREQARTALAPR